MAMLEFITSPESPLGSGARHIAFATVAMLEAANPSLTDLAADIAHATLGQLQAADEIGGCDSPQEYIALMDHLLTEIATRRAAAQATIDGDAGFPVLTTEQRAKFVEGLIDNWMDTVGQEITNETPLYTDAVAREGFIGFGKMTDAQLIREAGEAEMEHLFPPEWLADPKSEVAAHA